MVECNKCGIEVEQICDTCDDIKVDTALHRDIEFLTVRTKSDLDNIILKYENVAVVVYVKDENRSYYAVSGQQGWVEWSYKDI